MSTVRYPESGSAIKAARSLRRISQERLAEQAGTTRRHMIRLENGENRPSSDLRDRLAEVLGVPRDSLPAAEDEDEESSVMRISIDELLRLRIRELIREEAVV